MASAGCRALAGKAAGKKRFKVYPIGYFHIDIAEVCTEEGKLHLYVGIDRTSKFAFAQLHDKADRPTAVAFLEALIEAVPYNLHTILTDNGIQYSFQCVAAIAAAGADLTLHIDDLLDAI